MDKYQNNTLVEEMDAIILLNDNYSDKGLLKGYIGDVMSNFIEKYGTIIKIKYNPRIDYIEAIEKIYFGGINNEEKTKAYYKNMTDWRHALRKCQH